MAKKQFSKAVKRKLSKAETGKELPNVNKRQNTLEFIKGAYRLDALDADKPGRTPAGKTLRKVGNTVLKVGATPSILLGAPIQGLINSIRNKRDLRELSKQKLGGKIKKKK